MRQRFTVDIVALFLNVLLSLRTIPAAPVRSFFHVLNSFNVTSPLEVDRVMTASNVRLVADHGWAEVMRFATNCSAAAEGFSPGFKGDCGEKYVELGRPELASCSRKSLLLAPPRC